MEKLGSHHHRGGHRPPRSQVLEYVETSANPDQHWEWVSNERDRRFDQHGQAIWSVKTVAWLPRQAFYIARLLLDDFRGPFPPRSSFTCRCGLSGCVNPTHWGQVLRLPSVRLQSRPDGWLAVHVRSGKPLDRNTPIIVHSGDATTHVLIASPGVATTFRTLCGLEVYPANMVVHPRDAPVTCKKGCS